MTDEAVRCGIEKVLDAVSLYPEKQRKSREQRERELVAWYEKYHEVNEVYNLYGLDAEDAPPCDNYLDRGVFRRHRYVINSDYRPPVAPGQSRYSYSFTVLMRDKVSNEMFLSWAFAGRRERYVPNIGLFIGSNYKSSLADD